MPEQEVKVSYHNEMAKPTTKHNERSAEKPFNERTKLNEHWDCYGLGSSTQAEELFYNEKLMGIWEDTQARHLAKGRHAKLKSFQEWHYSKGNCPKESIIQLGSMEDDMSPDYCRACMKMFKDLNEEIENLYIISMDLHVDEATPHLHVRWVVLDKETGRVDYSNGLEQAGFDRPFDNGREQNNNELMTFTECMREGLENMAEAMGYNVNRERDEDAVHVDPRRYKKAMQALSERTQSVLTNANAEAAQIITDAETMAQKAFDAARYEGHSVALTEADETIGELSRQVNLLRKYVGNEKAQKIIDGEPVDEPVTDEREQSPVYQRIIDEAARLNREQRRKLEEEAEEEMDM